MLFRTCCITIPHCCAQMPSLKRQRKPRQLPDSGDAPPDESAPSASAASAKPSAAAPPKRPAPDEQSAAGKRQKIKNAPSHVSALSAQLPVATTRSEIDLEDEGMPRRAQTASGRVQRVILDEDDSMLDVPGIHEPAASASGRRDEQGDVQRSTKSIALAPIFQSGTASSRSGSSSGAARAQVSTQAASAAAELTYLPVKHVRCVKCTSSRGTGGTRF